MDKKVISSDPSYSSQAPELFMGKMSLLLFPINDLRSRDRERSEVILPNERGQKQGGPVKKKIELAVVMEIKRGGPIVDIVENRIQHPFAKHDGPAVRVPEFLVEPELRADFSDVGDAEDLYSVVAGEFFQRCLVLRLFFHHPILASLLLGCQRRLTRRME